MIESMYILIATAAACSILGVFLVLRNVSMVADAISHSVLLGIVLAAFIVRDLSSPFLIVGASLFGLVTVFAIEILIKSGLVKNDSSVGIVFPFLFSIGVILISRYGTKMHLDVDCILMGEVIFAPLNRIEVFSISIPKALLTMGTMFVINLTFVTVFFKELSLNTFDEEYATLSGFSAGFLLYTLMALVSITTVSAFDSVGAILVIAFLVAPAASAYLLTKRLKYTLIVAVFIGIFDAVVGYYLSLYLNLSMAGVTAFTMGIVFSIILLINPDGLIMRSINHRNNRLLILKFFILKHLSSHPERKSDEHGIDTMYRHLNKPKKDLDRICILLEKEGYLILNERERVYEITESGMYLYNSLLLSYKL